MAWQLACACFGVVGMQWHSVACMLVKWLVVAKATFTAWEAARMARCAAGRACEAACQAAARHLLKQLLYKLCTLREAHLLNLHCRPLQRKCIELAQAGGGGLARDQLRAIRADHKTQHPKLWASCCMPPLHDTFVGRIRFHLPCLGRV